MSVRRSTHTELRVVNLTTADVTTTSTIVADDYDWDNGTDRPDKNFNDVEIAAGTFVQRREEVNYYASGCPFTMSLTFADGTHDSYTIHQKAALGDAADFQHFIVSHDITYERPDGHTLQINIADKAKSKSKL